MFRRVLVPLDGSPDAETVLGHLPAFLAPDGGSVLLHVLPEPHPAAGESFDPWLAIQRYADDYLGEVSRRGVAGSPKTFVDVGEPGERIVKVAAALRADLVALMTNTWKGFPRTGCGDVSLRVMRRTRSAVLLVPPGRPPSERGPRKILVPLEGPGWYPSEVEPVLPVAARHGAEVVFLHVESPDPDPLEGGNPDPPLDIAARDRRRRYREAADYAKALGVESRALIVRGDPTREILSLVKSVAADLVAMTSHRRSGLERLVAGSVTESVIRSAECPVLVLRKAAVPSSAVPMNGVR